MLGTDINTVLNIAAVVFTLVSLAVFAQVVFVRLQLSGVPYSASEYH